MKRRKQRGYWEKRSEQFAVGTDAKSRAAALRNQEHVAHAVVDKVGDTYLVSYSVAERYVAELEKAGIKL